MSERIGSRRRTPVPWVRAAVSLVVGFVITVGIAWGSVWTGGPLFGGNLSSAVVVRGEHASQISIDTSRSRSDLRRYSFGRAYADRHLAELSRYGIDVVRRDQLPVALDSWLGALDLRRNAGKIAAVRVGWPLRSLEADARIDTTRANYGWSHGRGVLHTAWLPGAPTLPVAPLWPGLLVNTGFYAAIVFALSLLPGIARRWRRHRRDLCIACGYDLTGAPTTTGGACPECGAGCGTRP